jgi:hypothetical protein
MSDRTALARAIAAGSQVGRASHAPGRVGASSPAKGVPFITCTPPQKEPAPRRLVLKLLLLRRPQRVTLRVCNFFGKVDVDFFGKVDVDMDLMRCRLHPTSLNRYDDRKHRQG